MEIAPASILKTWNVTWNIIEGVLKAAEGASTSEDDSNND